MNEYQMTFVHPILNTCNFTEVGEPCKRLLKWCKSVGEMVAIAVGEIEIAFLLNGLLTYIGLTVI